MGHEVFCCSGLKKEDNLGVVTESKVFHLPHDVPVRDKVSGHGKHFIGKTSSPRRWRTNVPNCHLNLGLISSLFYIREGEEQEWVEVRRA